MSDTKTIKIVFSSNKTIGSALLSFFLFSRFSHTALVLDDIVFESRLTTGVSVDTVESFKERSHYIEAYELEITKDQYEKLLDFLVKQVGKKYDLAGVFGFVFINRMWDDDDKWFCSEYNIAGLAKSGILNLRQKYHRISPRDMWLLITNSLKVKPCQL